MYISVIGDKDISSADGLNLIEMEEKEAVAFI